jgi:predicted RNA binding protein YcfA (HicA-like mRNA interferase family)
VSGQPLSQKEIIRRLQRLGFEGPRRRKSKANHAFMVKGKLKATIPSDHGSDLSGPFIERMIKKLGISKADWEQAGNK